MIQTFLDVAVTFGIDYFRTKKWSDKNKLSLNLSKH